MVNVVKMRSESCEGARHGARGWARTPRVLAAVTLAFVFLGFLSPAADGIAAAQTRTASGSPGAVEPDPPCFDNLSRYVDCGNGTVTDSVTRLVWLQDAGCLGSVDWASGGTSVADLASGQCGLSDESRLGQWRLPTLDEWQATIAPAVAMGCSLEGAGAPPALTNVAGTECATVGPSVFFDVASDGH